MVFLLMPQVTFRKYFSICILAAFLPLMLTLDLHHNHDMMFDQPGSSWIESNEYFLPDSDTLCPVELLAHGIHTGVSFTNFVFKEFAFLESFENVFVHHRSAVFTQPRSPPVC